MKRGSSTLFNTEKETYLLGVQTEASDERDKHETVILVANQTHPRSRFGRASKSLFESAHKPSKGNMLQFKSTVTSKAKMKRPLFDAVVADQKKQVGENGTLEFTNDGIGSQLLAISQLVRGGSPVAIVKKLLADGSPVDVANLFVLMFITRNARGGKGEKKLSYDIFLELSKQYPDTAGKLLNFFPHYGYWKDLFHIMELAQADPTVDGDKINETCYDIMAEQLRKDMMTLDEDNNDTMSLLAKWLPRENSHFDKKLKFVNAFASRVFPGSVIDARSWESSAKAHYRKTLAALTERLKLPEVLLAAQREDEIRFKKLASKATLRLRRVFLNETKNGDTRSDNPKRIRLTRRFLKYTVNNGLKGGQLMPHEIVSLIIKKHNMSKGEELVLDAQWKSMRESLLKEMEGKDTTRMVPLSDVSGSMSGVPMEVSIALGILISEITHKAFRNLVMTFETKPRWHVLHSSQTIVQKVRSLARAPWGGSTNFEAAYDLLADVVVGSNLTPEDMPVLIVFSDMQIDQARCSYRSYGRHPTDKPRSDLTMHEMIETKLKVLADTLNWKETPNRPIVYWNLRNTDGHPVDKDTEGAVLLSGFSPSLLKLVMNGTILEETEVEVVQDDGTTKAQKIRATPEQVLLEMLQDDLYNPIRQVVGSSKEGKLAMVEAVPVGEQAEDIGADFEMVDA